MREFFDRKKELEKVSGVARLTVQDHFMDAMSVAPMLMGLPPVLGGKIVKRAAKPRIKAIRNRILTDDGKEAVKQFDTKLGTLNDIESSKYIKKIEKVISNKDTVQARKPLFTTGTIKVKDVPSILDSSVLRERKFRKGFKPKVIK